MSSPSPSRRGSTVTVGELSDPYGNFMVNPLPPGEEDVCEVCLTFTNPGFDACYRCGHTERFADGVLPVSYSQHGQQLHDALRSYKRSGSDEVRRKHRHELAAVLWRFLRDHEACLARRIGVDSFDVVTSVPSTNINHPLARIAGGIVIGTGERYEETLRRSAKEVEDREVDRGKFEPVRRIEGSVLLIDDTWASGASAQSAAAALKEGGAGPVGVVVIGRHMNDDRGTAKRKRLDSLPTPFDWSSCAYCR